MIDISRQILDSASAYGGSDVTQPSFNRTRYVRHGSVSEALDLGVLDDQDLFIDGEVGGAHGSSTIFYRFRTKEPHQIAARLVPVESTSLGIARLSSTRNSRPPRRQASAAARQPFSPLYLYIAISLTDASGQSIETRDSAFDQRSESSEPPRFADVDVEIGYAATGYWENGYAEQDGATVAVPTPILYFSEFEAVTVSALLENEAVEVQTVFGTFFVSPVLAYRPIDAGRIRLSSPLSPAGEFTLAVSSSQWSSIPYTLQLVLRGPASLRGTALLRLDAIPRLPVKALSGEITVRIDTLGFIPRSLAIQGAANLELRPSAAITSIRVTGT